MSFMRLVGLLRRSEISELPSRVRKGNRVTDANLRRSVILLSFAVLSNFRNRMLIALPDKRGAFIPQRPGIYSQPMDTCLSGHSLHDRCDSRINIDFFYTNSAQTPIWNPAAFLKAVMFVSVNPRNITGLSTSAFSAVTIPGSPLFHIELEHNDRPERFSI